MDYGFAPGGTDFDLAARDYLEWRPASEAVVPANPSVQSFVSTLKTSSSIVRPVGDLGIGCHGREVGLLEIQLEDGSASRRTEWEEADRAVGTKSVGIDPTVLNPRPQSGGSPVPARFRIVGCIVGHPQARPFLERLKAALGGAVTIVAARHDDSLRRLDNLGLDGIFRFLIYAFQITTAVPLEGQLDAILAFDAKKFRFLDNSLVPRSVWERIIPTDVGIDSPGVRSRMRRLDLDPQVGPLVSLNQQGAEQYEWSLDTIGPFKTAAPSGNLASSAQRRAFMATQMRNHPLMKEGHAFPLFRRWGYPSFDAFMDGLDWMDKPGDRQKWTGFRNVHTVRVPITFPVNSDKVLYDFVSRTGSPSHLGLIDSDTRLFTTV
jgi:hypothetical protein